MKYSPPIYIDLLQLTVPPGRGQTVLSQGPGPSFHQHLGGGEDVEGEVKASRDDKDLTEYLTRGGGADCGDWDMMCYRGYCKYFFQFFPA